MRFMTASPSVIDWTGPYGQLRDVCHRHPRYSHRHPPVLCRHPRESGDPVINGEAAEYWFPAFAGMTSERALYADRNAW
jgi:hypothetical protein